MKGTQQKIALITGGNRGLGLQTALELGRLGIDTVLGVRDPEKGASAVHQLASEGFHAEVIRLDVADPTTHAEAYRDLESRYGKLDILINNAGVWKESTTSSSYMPAENHTSSLAIEILRETFETNFFGTVQLTQRLLPLIRKAPAGRIVNVSSIMGSLTLHSDPASSIYPHKVFAYDASKNGPQRVYRAPGSRTEGHADQSEFGASRLGADRHGGEGADMDISEGGKTSAGLATLPADGPTGGYFHLWRRLPW